MSRTACGQWGVVLLLGGLLGCQREVGADRQPSVTLQGRWEVVSSEFEGQPATAAYRAGTVIVIEGDKLHFTDGFAKSDPTNFRLHAQSKPNGIDIGEDKGERKATRGIYELDGDSLKLCLGLAGERPKEFKTAAGDKTNLLVLKRQKP